ncbi:MAG: ABC transporter permease [Defluviitaleaceae bacterium]|nr:ABC transporter permease [Defluviitaleaceae bacterium]
MQLLESFSSAIKSIFSYKMRSLLTMLGIIIGISSVITITSLGDGVYNAMHEAFADFNMNSIQVFPRGIHITEDGGFGIEQLLHIDDVAAINSVHNVVDTSAIVELSNHRITLRNGETRLGMAIGTDPNWSSFESFTMLHGRFIQEQDMIANSFVAVLAPWVSVDIFGFVNSVGRTFDVTGDHGRFTLTVIGIVDVERDVMAAGGVINTDMFAMPVTTAGLIRNTPGIVDAFQITLDDPALTTATSDQIVRLLNHIHDREDAFGAMGMTEALDMLDAVMLGVTAFIAFVAGISLFVGGVGVMNIMMVTVTERTREIGIRKSLGATGLIIRLQFVLEAVILTLMGGIIGIAFGLASSFALTAVINMAVPEMEIISTVNPGVIAIAIAVSMMVGIVFGVYPAAKAANLDPVDSLRYE